MSVKLKHLKLFSGKLKLPIKMEMLRCFSIVAQTGNLAAAADRLGRTQSAVSMTLKQLEDHLGQKLFEGERKNRLTLLGEQVFALSRNQIQSFDVTVREIETSASSPQGLLRIASIPSAAGLLVPAAVEALMTRHRGLKVDIRDTDTALVIEALVRGQADVGIASDAPSLNEIRITPLFEDRFGLTCAPDHPLAVQSKPVHLADLPGQGFVGNNLCHQIDHPVIRRVLGETRVHAHNMFSLIGMLQTGGSVTVLPQTVARDLPGGLFFRPIEDLSAARAVSALTAQRSSQRGIAAEFVALLGTMV